MFLTIAIILLLLWIAGLAFKVAGSLIHTLLVLGIIALVWHFVSVRVT